MLTYMLPLYCTTSYGLYVVPFDQPDCHAKLVPVEPTEPVEPVGPVAPVAPVVPAPADPAG